MRPPILTKRQFQVLTLIHCGASRREIADELNLSPETVKSHTSAILTAFGTGSVRAAIAQINFYMTHYGQVDTQSGIFIDRLCRTTNVASDYLSSHLSHISSGIVVRGVLDRIMVGLRCPLPPKDVTINGRAPDIVEEAGENRNFTHLLDVPLVQGQEFSRDARYTVVEPGTRPLTSIAEWIRFPVGAFQMIVQFSGPMPENLTTFAMTNQGRISVTELHPNAQITLGRTSKITLTNPVVGARYFFDWAAPETLGRSSQESHP